MLNGELFRQILTERLTSVGLEIFCIFEQTVADYESEIKRSGEENARLLRLLDVFNRPENNRHRADPQQPSLPEPPQIKDEQQLWTSQREDTSQLSLVYQTPVVENSGDSLPIRTTDQIKAEPDGEDYGEQEPDVDSQSPSVSSDCPTVPCLGEVESEGLPSKLKPSKLKATQISKLQISLRQVEPPPQKKKLPIEDLLRGKKSFKSDGVPEPTNNCRYPSGVTQDCPTALTLEEESGGLMAETEPRTTVFSLQRHEQTYHGDLQYKHDLMKTHTGEKPYSCPECGKCFSVHSGLCRHMRTHTGEKPYKCWICSKGFSLSCNRLKHMRTHTGEKPYQCQECGKYFSRRYNMFIHMKTHTGERPHQCQACDKSFIQKCGLKKHMRIHT